MLQQQCLQTPGWTRRRITGQLAGDVSRGHTCSRVNSGSSGSSRNSSRCRASAAPTGPDATHLYSSDGDLQLYIGPVTPIRLRGVGLALEASKTLQAGDILLVSKPLAVVPRSDEAAAALADEAASATSSGNWVIPLDEEIEAVAEAIGSAGSRTQAWLTFLDDGSLEHAQSTAMPDLQALADSSSNSSGSSPADQQDEDRLLDIADINTRVLVEDDRLTAAAGAEPQTVTGIWPVAGLMQHSCSPNTTVLLHKSCAIVTSSRSIPKEAGVYQNVLGSEVFTPLTHRQGLLSNLLSDKCSCPRCRDEARQDPKLLQLVDDIFEACVEQVQTDLQQAVEVDNEEAVENLRNQLAAYCEVVDAGFSKLGVKQQSQIWLQASLFRLYELTAIASAAVGEPQPQLVELLAALAAQVSPGSSEHLFWMQQFRTILAEDEDAPFDGSLASADKRCRTAFELRYGRGISHELYTRLLLAGAQASADDGDDDGEVEVEFMFEGSS